MESTTTSKLAPLTSSTQAPLTSTATTLTSSTQAPLTSTATTLTSTTQAPLTSAATTLTSTTVLRGSIDRIDERFIKIVPSSTTQASSASASTEDLSAYKAQLTTFLQVASGASANSAQSQQILQSLELPSSLTLNGDVVADTSKAITLSQLAAISLYQSITDVVTQKIGLALNEINVNNYVSMNLLEKYYDVTISSVTVCVEPFFTIPIAIATGNDEVDSFNRAQAAGISDVQRQLTSLISDFSGIVKSTVDQLFNNYLHTSSDGESNPDVVKVKALYAEILYHSLVNIANSAFDAYIQYTNCLCSGENFFTAIGQRQISPISMQWEENFREVIESMMIESCLPSISVMSALIVSCGDLFTINPDMTLQVTGSDGKSVAYQMEHINALFKEIIPLHQGRQVDFATQYQPIIDIKTSLEAVVNAANETGDSQHNLATIISGEMTDFEWAFG